MTWLARLYIWATYRLYDELAWAYDPVSWVVSLGRWSRWRRMALEHLEGRRVLEIGFGTGELLLEMAARGLDVVGLDLSPAMHRITARKAGRRGVMLSRVRAAVQAAPFAGGSFDSIVSTFPAGYILEAATLLEMARLLRPPDPAGGDGGGRLLVVGLVVYSDNRLWRWAVRLLFGEQDESVLERFARMAAGAGLQVRVVDPARRGLRVPVIVAWREGE